MRWVCTGRLCRRLINLDRQLAAQTPFQEFNPGQLLPLDVCSASVSNFGSRSMRYQLTPASPAFRARSNRRAQSAKRL